MSSEADYQRLAAYVRSRRRRLGLRQSDVASLGGPSTATLREIEGAKPGGRHLSTFWQLERILGWRPGSAEAILRGAEPQVAADPDYRALRLDEPTGADRDEPPKAEGDTSLSTSAPAREPGVGDVAEDEVTEAIRRSPVLHDRARQHLIQQYDMLRELSELTDSKEDETPEQVAELPHRRPGQIERPLRTAARRGKPDKQ